jgi:hypothetical protein
VQRVCRAWAVPRSTFYRAKRPNRPAAPQPRGPKPWLDDAGLLAAIQADLAASPFTGEGHRKVWARLRYGLGLPVGRNRVLRQMRQHQLLLPFRRPPRPANDHDGTLLTDAPDGLWGTDATLVPTVADGRVWVFAAIDHGNAEVIGHFVSTDGSRFSALEPIAQAVAARFGGIGADGARGDGARRPWPAARVPALHPAAGALGRGPEPQLPLPAADQRGDRAGLPHAEGAGDLGSDLPRRRRGAGGVAGSWRAPTPNGGWSGWAT